MALSELKLVLSDWDNKHTDYLMTCYNSYCNATHFIPELIQLLSNEKLQKASSWLLKYHSEQSQFTSLQIANIIVSTSVLQHWESQLHILQMLPKLHIDKNKQVN